MEGVQPKSGSLSKSTILFEASPTRVLETGNTCPLTPITDCQSAPVPSESMVPTLQYYRVRHSHLELRVTFLQGTHLSPKEQTPFAYSQITVLAVLHERVELCVVVSTILHSQQHEPELNSPLTLSPSASSADSLGRLVSQFSVSTGRLGSVATIVVVNPPFGRSKRALSWRLLFGVPLSNYQNAIYVQ